MAKKGLISGPAGRISRRRFLVGGSLATASMMAVRPSVAFGASANSRIELGLIGCGQRGNWIAGLFEEQGGFKVTAVADYFPDRAKTAGEKFGVDTGKRFTGLNAYRQLLETGIEAVAIESPPYFHPEQAEAAVRAGKHVFLAKPIAVDAPGCLNVSDSARLATENNLAFVIDFQTRANDLFIEALHRVHGGVLGTLAFGEANYHAENPWKNQVAYLESDPRNAENRLRAWGLNRALSGDIIVEQNIHTLDVMNWVMQNPPTSAYGLGGKVRNDPGNCWDHFVVTYHYPDGVGWSFNSRQFEGYEAPDYIKTRAFGSRGVLSTDYFGEVFITGEQPFEGGKTGSIYRDGAFRNIQDFHRAITENRFDNPTAEPSVRSNLIGILGREAAYEGRVMTWEQLLKNPRRIEPDLDGLAA